MAEEHQIEIEIVFTDGGGQRTSHRCVLPGRGFIVIALLLQQVIVSSVLLVSAPSFVGWFAENALVACSGVLAAGIVFVLLASVLDRRSNRFRAKGVPQASDCRRSISLGHLVQWLTSASTLWHPRVTQLDALFVRNYGFLFEMHRDGRHAWLLVDMTATVVLSVLGGVVPSSVEACERLRWAVFSVCGAFFLLIVAQRPMCSPMEACFTTLLSGGQLVVALCGALDASPVAEAIGLALTMMSAALVALTVCSVISKLVSKYVTDSRIRFHKGDERTSQTQVNNISSHHEHVMMSRPSISKSLIVSASHGSCARLRLLINEICWQRASCGGPEESSQKQLKSLKLEKYNVSYLFEY